ncbi:MAG: class I SAM-dependent methyltransferase [Chlamydiales bacterium]
MTLFRSHIKIAHDFWKKILTAGDCAIDATCGNGHDSLFIAELIGPEGELHCIDVQEAAIECTRTELKYFIDITRFHLGSHVTLPSVSPKLIVYNLGYLPGADKSLTTMTDTTLKSVQNALEIIQPGGLISITCYPGHPEGKIEQEALFQFVSEISNINYIVSTINWTNRPFSPSLIFIESKIN